MNRFPHAVAICLLLASCATSDEGKSKEVARPETQLPAAMPADSGPSAQPDPAPSAATPTAAIASVQMAQDCAPRKQAPAAAPGASAKPDPGPSPEPAAGAPSRSRRQADSSGSFAQPCTQSSIQISLTGVATAGTQVVVKELRLLTVDGKQVATVESRMPTLWKNDGYAAWDGTLTADPEHKASYQISVPDWAALEKTTGKSSYNVMFVLDVDIDVGGTVTTVRSPQFERTQPMMIRT